MARMKLHQDSKCTIGKAYIDFPGGGQCILVTRESHEPIYRELARQYHGTAGWSFGFVKKAFKKVAKGIGKVKAVTKLKGSVKVFSKLAKKYSKFGDFADVLGKKLGLGKLPVLGKAIKARALLKKAGLGRDMYEAQGKLFRMATKGKGKGKRAAIATIKKIGKKRTPKAFAQQAALLLHAKKAKTTQGHSRRLSIVIDVSDWPNAKLVR